jgi:hypothetical protein
VLRLTESVVADEGEEMQGKNLAQPSDLTRPRAATTKILEKAVSKKNREFTYELLRVRMTAVARASLVLAEKIGRAAFLSAQKMLLPSGSCVSESRTSPAYERQE